MNTYRPITVDDKPLFDRILQLSGKQGAEFCFTTLYSWAPTFGSEWEPVGDSFVVHSKGGSLLFPGTLDFAYLDKNIAEGALINLVGLTEQDSLQLEDRYPGRFHIDIFRDGFDYIYHSADLMTLKGKKYQAKRNHLNAFMNDYPSVEVEAITAENVLQCLDMNKKWCELMGCKHNAGLSQETCAVSRILSSFASLKLEGILVRIDGEIVAYTIGEQLNANTYLVHVEKAFPQYRGLYQFINCEFVKRACAKNPDITFINREDDNGDDGLRRAKLSYHPAYLLEKYMATLQATQ